MADLQRIDSSQAADDHQVLIAVFRHSGRQLLENRRRRNLSAEITHRRSPPLLRRKTVTIVVPGTPAERWRWDLAAVASEVAVAEVVGEDDDNVRRRRCRRDCGGGEQGYNMDELSDDQGGA